MSFFYELFQFSATCNYTLCYFFRVTTIIDIEPKTKSTWTSLQREKDSVKEVKKGLECGITVENFNDLKVGDIIEAYEMVEIKR